MREINSYEDRKQVEKKWKQTKLEEQIQMRQGKFGGERKKKYTGNGKRHSN